MNLEIDRYTENANTVKNEVLSRLLKEGVISAEQCEEYTTKWVFMIFKYGWFKKWREKYSPTNSEKEWGYHFTKIQDDKNNAL
jgi:hypothetical protein